MNVCKVCKTPLATSDGEVCWCPKHPGVGYEKVNLLTTSMGRVHHAFGVDIDAIDKMADAMFDSMDKEREAHNFRRANYRYIKKVPASIRTVREGAD